MKPPRPPLLLLLLLLPFVVWSLTWRRESALCLEATRLPPADVSVTVCAVQATLRSSAAFRQDAAGRCSVCSEVTVAEPGGADSGTFVTWPAGRLPAEGTTCSGDTDCPADGTECSPEGRCRCRPSLTVDWDMPHLCRPVYDEMRVVEASSDVGVLPADRSAPWPVDCNANSSGASVLTAIADGKSVLSSMKTSDIDYIKCSVPGGGFQLLAYQVTEIVLLDSNTGASIHRCPADTVITGLFDPDNVVLQPFRYEQPQNAKCTTIGAEWRVGHHDECVNVGIQSTDALGISAEQAGDASSSWTAECPRDKPYAITALLASNWRWETLVCCQIAKRWP